MEPYQERLKQEYESLCVRARKLGDMLDRWDRLDFTPACTRQQLNTQLCAMKAYKTAIEDRSDFIAMRKNGFI